MAPLITIGAVINGRFRVDEILGAGGMGIVVGATHLELGSRVAIKLLRDDMAQAPTIVERFLREARAVVQLRTDHVCRVIDVGRLDNGAPFIVMELLAGSDLAAAVKRGPLPATVAVEYVMQACVALAEAHGAGLIHRDLKPANLFVTRRLDGGPLIKVLDFGIAKANAETDAHLTQTVGAMGSLGYMSPEQVYSARDVDVRTDIWALGVTLYQLLSARLPFPATNATELALQIANEVPPALDVAPELRAVVLRCLAKPPADRYPDVVELAVALVPFGGPSARQIATTVGQIANRMITLPRPAPGTGPRSSLGSGPREVAQVALTAPTVATVATAPAPPHAAVASTNATRRRRSPWFGVVLVLGVLGVGGGAMAIAIRGQQAGAPVPDAGSAAPRSAPRLDAIAPRPASVDAAAAAADPPAPAQQDAAPAPDPDEPSLAAALAAGSAALVAMPAQMREVCKMMQSGQVAGVQIPALQDPAALLMCHCVLGDRTQALAAIAQLKTEAARREAREQCAVFGMKLD